MILETAKAVLEATTSMRATVARLSRENDALGAENFRLRRELAKARLLADLRMDAANLAADAPVSIFHRKQAE
jgi:regulator of replication initiation timing